jgi:hypothetical protein
MVPPFMTTTKYNSKGKKLPNTASKRDSNSKHNAWLKKNGVHLDQIELTKIVKGEFKNKLPDLTTNTKIPLGNNIPVKGGYRNGILDNLSKETPEIQKEILAKAARTAPAYSKGNYVYITDQTDLSDIGKKK